MKNHSAIGKTDYPHIKDRKERRSSAACRIISLCCALLLLFSLCSTAFVADKVQPKTVRVGYYENEIFEEGAREGAVKTGYAYEYYRKLSEYTGWDYEYVYGNFSDLYDKLLRGEVDLLAGLAYKEDRDGLIAYPETPMGNESYTLVKHKSDEDITSTPSSVSGKTIGALRGAITNALNLYLEKEEITAEVVSFDDLEELYAAFDGRRIDILAAEGDGTAGRNDAEVLFPFGSSDYYLCVSISRPDLLKDLNTAQEQLKIEEPDYINTLSARYYSSSISSRTVSQAEKKWVETHDSLRVGYIDNFLPHSDTDKDGNPTGIVIDLIPEILRALDIKDIEVSYHAYPGYDELITDMREGNIDAGFPIGGGLYFSEENDIYQTIPVTTSTLDLVYNDAFDEKTNAVFAINENNRIQYYSAKTLFPDAQYDLYPSIEACLDAVASGKATCTDLNGLRSDNLLKNRKYRDLSTRQISTSEALCFGVEIGNDGLLKLLNRGLNILGSDYTNKLAYRYTDELNSYTLMDAALDNLPLVATILIVIAALIIFLLIRDKRRRKKRLAAVEASRKELEEKNIELAQSKEALSDALAAAEHANRAKTAFLNSISHDIRTPMNAIVGFTAMAATHIDNKEQVQDYLSKISVSSRHLLSLINDVLDMSRIESGKMKIEETQTRLPDIIHDLRTILQGSIKAKNQDLYIDTQDVRNEDIITDKLRLSQMLLNILTNAVKFTPPGGTISFRVIEKPVHTPGMTSFEFRIKDNGIGMSEEFQKTIFDAFTRESDSTVSSIQGTGLGMAISKNIVDMMGGTISVSSQKGKGSEFTVNLPCRLPEHPTEYTRLTELEGLRALVADDDTNTCLSVCSMLRDIGMRPDWTNYGKEAVIRAKEAHENADSFSVYIIDWMMPDMNGIETVRRIRKLIGDNTPIIILTAYDWADIETEAREAGVTAFCTKPLFMSELRKVLSEPFSIKPETDEESEKKLDFSGKRILLAEDNEMNRIIAISILEEHGLTVEVAEDGEKALNMVSSADAGYYDAVLMDIQMPVMNGYESAKQIRLLSDPQKASVPIIAVTANAFEEDRRIALEAGMNGHLAKPYDIPMMLETLSETFNNK